MNSSSAALLTPPLEAPWSFLATSPARQHVLRLAQRVSSTLCPVMIIGPTGVGKEVLANDIHRHSARASGPFVAVNCGAFSPALFDSAFWGHVRGSFTGATTDKPGFVELAHGGTLFLDEVGDLPPDAQAKLLRFIAQGTYWPVGGTTERRANVRILSATHRRIDTALNDHFRQDLFFRLSVVLLRIPEPTADDMRAISHTLIIEALHRHKKAMSPAEINELGTYCMARDWRGGVREMQNAIERFVLLLDTGTDVAEQLEAAMGADKNGVKSGVRVRRCDVTVAKSLEDLLFLHIAQECTDVRDLAAQTDRTVQAVYNRLKKLGLRPDDLGPTFALQEMMERLREKLAPHEPWIQSAVFGK